MCENTFFPAIGVIEQEIVPDTVSHNNCLNNWDILGLAHIASAKDGFVGQLGVSKLKYFVFWIIAADKISSSLLASRSKDIL